MMNKYMLALCSFSNDLSSGVLFKNFWSFMFSLLTFMFVVVVFQPGFEKVNEWGDFETLAIFLKLMVYLSLVGSIGMSAKRSLDIVYPRNSRKDFASSQSSNG